MRMTFHVFKKESRDILRDKRVLRMAFIMPIFLVAMMMSLFGFLTTAISKTHGQIVYVVKTKNPAEKLIVQKPFEVVEIPDVSTGRKLIREGKAHIVLSYGEMKPDGQTVIDAYVDPKEQTSQIALAMVSKLYDVHNKKKLETLLEENRLPLSSEEVYKVRQQDVSVGEQAGASDILIGILPYLIVMYAFYGGMSIAADMIAGEKEKNTLETLLISPAHRTNIVLGKFLALATVCLISSLSCFLGLVLVAAVKPPGTAEMMKGGFGVTPMAFFVTMIVLMPLVAFFASALVAISSFARNSREAQTYLTQFSFVIILPAMFSQFIGYTDMGHSQWINFIPVLNAANNIRMALMGRVDMTSLAITIGVSLVIALIALRITVKLFNKEEVLVRV